MPDPPRLLPFAPPAAMSLWPPEAWQTLLASRANLLVTGPVPVCAIFVEAMKPHIRPPVCSVSGSGVLALPDRVGTLIVRSPEALDQPRQRQLLDWLNRRHAEPAQVIAVTSVPLYARVEGRQFLDELYYRLNVIRVDVGPVDTAGSAGA